MQQKSIVYMGATISYKTTGTGIPVVLLHGFGEDCNIWQQQVAHLKNNYQLIIPDIPGSGRSTIIQKENTGLEDYAGCVKNILDKENIAKAVLIGHSMGGYTALAFAEKYASSLIALGLFHSSAYADDCAKIETRKKAIAFIESNSAIAFLKTAIPGLFYDADKSKADIDELLQMGANFSAAALIQYYAAMIARPDRVHVLKAIKLPVLFILGQHDKAVPFNHGLQQTHLPNYSNVTVLRESAHMGMLEETAKSNAILAGFLRNL